MKERSAQVTTARDIGLLMVAGAVLLVGVTLLLATRVLAQTAPVVTGPTVAESSITETSATVSWTVSPPSTGQVEFGETRELGRLFRSIVAIEETEVISTSHDIWLFELKPGTTYYYRIRSTTEDGRTVISEIRTFMTKTPPPLERDADIAEPEPETENVSDGAEEPAGDDAIRAPVGEPGDAAEQEADAVRDEDDEDAEQEVAAPRNLTVRTSEAKPAADRVVAPARPPTEDGADAPRLSEDATRILFRSAQEDDEFSVGIHMFGEDDGEPRTLSPELMEDIAAFAEEVGRNPNGAFLSGTMGATDVRGYGEELCEQNFIRPSACVSWLIGEFADASCRDAGLLTKGACEHFLSERNGGVFPGCETLDALECDEHRVLVTIDLMPDDLFEDVDRIIEQAGRELALVALPHMTSLRSEHVDRARWWGSPRAPGQQTSLGMIVIDTDMDGLPDDYEASLGTDPLLADSDGDGIDDITELQRGTNPLGPGRFGRELRDSEKTIVFKQPLEQPAAKLNADDGMAVWVNGSSDGLTGKCEPGQTCILYFYSYVPMVLTTTADASGNWQYDLSDTMTDGHHTVYVAVTDDTGKIVKRSGALSFFVNEAQAVTFDDFVAASVEPAAAFTQGTPEQAFFKYLYGAIALVLIATFLAIGILSKRPAVRGME